VTHVLQSFHDIGGRATEFVGDGLLFVDVESEVLLTEVAIDTSFDREVSRAIGLVIAAAQRHCMLSHMHFEMHEEINVLARDERYEGTNSPTNGGIEENISAALHQRRAFD